jgi:hypothetical protein
MRSCDRDRESVRLRGARRHEYSYASVTITNTHGKRNSEGKVGREGGTYRGSIHVRSR